MDICRGSILLKTPYSRINCFKSLVWGRGVSFYMMCHSRGICHTRLCLKNGKLRLWQHLIVPPQTYSSCPPPWHTAHSPPPDIPLPPRHTPPTRRSLRTCSDHYDIIFTLLLFMIWIHQPNQTNHIFHFQISIWKSHVPSSRHFTN